jgi:hypothetical protein
MQRHPRQSALRRLAVRASQLAERLRPDSGDGLKSQRSGAAEREHTDTDNGQ